MKNNRSVSNTSIVSAARKAKTLRDLAKLAGYGRHSERYFTNDRYDIGSNSIKRIKKVIGGRVYREITSHRRNKKSRSTWTMPK